MVYILLSVFMYHIYCGVSYAKCVWDKRGKANLTRTMLHYSNHYSGEKTLLYYCSHTCSPAADAGAATAATATAPSDPCTQARTRTDYSSLSFHTTRSHSSPHIHTTVYRPLTVRLCDLCLDNGRIHHGLKLNSPLRAKCLRCAVSYSYFSIYIWFSVTAIAYI